MPFVYFVRCSILIKTCKSCANVDADRRQAKTKIHATKALQDTCGKYDVFSKLENVTKQRLVQRDDGDHDDDDDVTINGAVSIGVSVCMSFH